ncbi:MAG TPA: NifU family protein [Polyangia bacterium]|nr:NifU family protein [Polyangia bacterium]
MSAADGEVGRRLRELETLVGEVERLGDAAARDKTRAIVRAVLDLHAAGLERLFAVVATRGEPIERAILDGCAADPLVASLLLLHGLHPLGLEARVRAALDELRAAPGDVELIGIADGVVRVRVASAALRTSVEAALVEAAPDAAAIELEGGAPAALVSAERLRASAPR